MRHILTCKNGKALKKLHQAGINEVTQQIDFAKIRPIPDQIAEALVDNRLANAAIGFYMLNLGFNRNDIPSPVLALIADLKQNGDEFYDQVGPKRRRYLETFQEIAATYDEPLTDELEKSIMSQLKQELDEVEAYLMRCNVDLHVFADEETENVAEPITKSFGGLDLSLLAWCARKGKELVDNYVAFQAFNLGDWTLENWKITENAFNTEIDKKNDKIIFETHQIIGITDLMDSLGREAEIQPEEWNYTYQL